MNRQDAKDAKVGEDSPERPGDNWWKNSALARSNYLLDSPQVITPMPIDAAELAQLIERQAAALQLWVRSRCLTCEDEDVVQEAFCRLAVQEPSPESPVAWLYRVCRNLAEKYRLSDERRRMRERARSGLIAMTSEGVDPLELEETLAAVEMLDADLREVLVARIWGQLSLEEIGNLCGLSTTTAFRRYEAALRVLRQQLESNCENRP